MKKTITFLSVLFLGIITTATAQQQGKKATLNEDGTISVETVTLPENYYSQEKTQVFDMLWRFGEPAHPNFKNSRGTTLADIDNDGVDEILYGIWNTLYALEGNGDVLPIHSDGCVVAEGAVWLTHRYRLGVEDRFPIRR